MTFSQQLRYYPFIRILIPFVTGIIAAIYIRTGIVVPLFLIVFLFLLLVTPLKLYKQYRFRWFFGFVFNLIICLSGFFLVNLHHEKMESLNKLAGKQFCYKAYVFDSPQEKEKTVKTVLKTIAIPGNHDVHRPVKILAYFKKSSTALSLKEGDILIINSELSGINGPRNPEEFDYKRLMYNRGVGLQTYIQADKWRDIGQKKTVRVLSSQVRDKLLDIYRRNGLKDDELGIMAALTLGNREEITEDITQMFVAVGALHVLAVSGLHVGIIYFLFDTLLKFILRFRNANIIRIVVIILVLWMFAFIAGLKPSVVRAAFMFSIIHIGINLRKPADIYNTIATSAFFLLLINPMQIAEPAFQLSYLAVISIVFFEPRIYSLLVFRNWLADQVWMLLSVSFAAQLGTAPISILYFHQFPVYFWIANVILIPIVTLLIYLGITLMVFDLVHLPAFIVAKVITLVIRFMHFCMSLIGEFPCSFIENINVDKAEVLLMYLVIIVTSAFILLRKPRLLHGLLSLFFLFLILNTYKVLSLRQKNKFIVFNVRNNSAVCLFSGREALLLHTLPDNDYRPFGFAIKNCLIKSGVANKVLLINMRNKICSGDVHPFWYRYDSKNVFFAMPGLNGLLIKEEPAHKCYSEYKLKLDFIILADNAPVTIDQLTRLFDFRQLILDSSNSYYYCRKINNQAITGSIPVYSVLEGMAFETDIQKAHSYQKNNKVLDF